MAKPFWGIGLAVWFARSEHGTANLLAPNCPLCAGILFD